MRGAEARSESHARRLRADFDRLHQQFLDERGLADPGRDQRPHPRARRPRAAGGHNLSCDKNGRNVVSRVVLQRRVTGFEPRVWRTTVKTHRKTGWCLTPV